MEKSVFKNTYLNSSLDNGKTFVNLRTFAHFFKKEEITAVFTMYISIIFIIKV